MERFVAGVGVGLTVGVALGAALVMAGITGLIIVLVVVASGALVLRSMFAAADESRY